MSTPNDAPRRLDSWKEIAAYLGRDVRTAMRWARHQGLPVYRIGGRRRGSVYADPAEIDQWLRGGSQVGGNADPPVPGPRTDPAVDTAASTRRPGERRRSWVLAAAAAGGVLLAVVLVARYPSASPAIERAAIIGRDVVAFDARGRELWRSTLARENENLIPNNPRIFRWDAGGPPYVLVAVERQRRDGGGSGSLALLTGTGMLAWTQTIEDRYTLDGVGYGPAWYPNDVLPFRANGSSWIAASFHHQTWWPSVVATFDRDGLVTGRFFNTGWIHKLNVSADGRYLLASGMSNMLGGAILAVLDS